MGMMASGFPLCVENETFRVRGFSLKRFGGPSVSVQRATGFLNMKPRKERPQEAPALPATPTRRRRRARRYALSPEDLIERLRELYIHLVTVCSPNIRQMSQISGVPFETLRHFVTDFKHKLCAVNEEKLARGLGHDGAFFRRVVQRFSHLPDWKERCASACLAHLRP
jgi:hypothetical protein